MQHSQEHVQENEDGGTKVLVAFFSSVDGSGLKAPRLRQVLRSLAMMGARTTFVGTGHSGPSALSEDLGLQRTIRLRAVERLSNFVQKVAQPFGVSSMGRFIGYQLIGYIAARELAQDRYSTVFTQTFMWPLVKKAKKLGIRVIVESSHEHPLRAWLQNSERARVNRLLPWEREPWNFKPLMKSALKSVARADTVLVFGQTSLRSYTSAGHSENQLISVFPGPREGTLLAKKTSAQPAFVWVGNHGTRKGIDIIEAAWKIYKDSGGHGVLHLCGAISPSQKRFRRRLRARTDVIDHGHIDVVSFFASERKALLAPSFSEGLPRATVEAMACGLPVIGSEAGTGGLVKTDQNGWLVSPEAYDVAQAMNRLSSDWSRVQQLGDDAYRTVVSLCTGFEEIVAASILEQSS